MMRRFEEGDTVKWGKYTGVIDYIDVDEAIGETWCYVRFREPPRGLAGTRYWYAWKNTDDLCKADSRYDIIDVRP